jgi:hypothetical protein
LGILKMQAQQPLNREERLWSVTKSQRPKADGTGFGRPPKLHTSYRSAAGTPGRAASGFSWPDSTRDHSKSSVNRRRLDPSARTGSSPLFWRPLGHINRRRVSKSAAVRTQTSLNKDDRFLVR